MRYTFEVFKAEVELASKTVSGRPTWTTAAGVLADVLTQYDMDRDMQKTLLALFVGMARNAKEEIRKAQDQKN